jgi:diguanylate cyclase (GGDEF)-like protein
MDADGAGIARKHVRALVVAGETDDPLRWSVAAREDVSLGVRSAATIAGSLEILQSQDLDIALVGAAFADGSYRDLLRALQLAREDLAIVVVAALERHALREAFALGAADVVAPDDLVRLGPAIVRALREGARAAMLRRKRDRAIDERDPVTGLPQRTAFERYAQCALRECERDGCALAVLFLDVDRFRIINELGDHAAGDTVLREVAARLHDALPDAYVARFGGDEFVLLQKEYEPEAARAAAAAAIAVFGMPFWVSGKSVFLTASVGVASAPDHAVDVAALIGNAEAAVFEAKRLGRNMVRWYRSSGSTSSLERVLTRRDLHGAIERNEFELYYQPMYDVETRAIAGVEALLRWRHPVHGLMLPDRFIPVAEEFGLIEEIGAWAMDRAIAQVREWADIGIPAVRVSVNVSARQLDGDALPALVQRLLAKYEVAASCLEIEITESSIMRDVPAALRLLHALRALGVRVSIDDFGTGYTSLAFLKRFPVDVLKIDRSFVADVADGVFDGALVRAVTTLARGLGVRTVAEGVEKEAQFDRLRALDCDVVQGFLLCHPLPVAACTPLLGAANPIGRVGGRPAEPGLVAPR